MSLKVRHRGGVDLIDLEGPLTGGPRADALRAAVDHLLAGGARHIVVNLQATPFIDSLGLGELLACKKEAIARGGDVGLLVLTGKVYGVLVDASLDRVFETFTDETAAVDA